MGWERGEGQGIKRKREQEREEERWQEGMKVAKQFGAVGISNVLSGDVCVLLSEGIELFGLFSAWEVALTRHWLGARDQGRAGGSKCEIVELCKRKFY